MSDNEMDDAEASYRRGYQQGAWDAIQAADSMTREKLLQWRDKTLPYWRYSDHVENRGVSPPRPWLQFERVKRFRF
jgi:hypothetical protein